MLFKLFILLGVGVLAVALRSFQSSFSQKAGAIAILIVSYLLVYFVTDSHALGAIAAVAWFFLPWVEILTRIRTLRLPKEKQLRPKSPPSSDTFPTLSEITREIENEGFIHMNDAGWDWEDYRQFFRLFYKAEDRAQATICLNEQHDLSFYYLRISSRARSGVIWTTWNYPLSYGLKLTPQFRINRSGNFIKVTAHFCGRTTSISISSKSWMKTRSRRKWNATYGTRSRTTSPKACSSKRRKAM
jgi:hypothetical protein